MTTSLCGNARWKSHLRVTDKYSGVLKEHLRRYVKHHMAEGISCSQDVYVFKALDRFLTETNAPPDCLLEESVIAFCAKREDESQRNFENRSSAIRRFGRYLSHAGCNAYVLPTFEETQPSRPLYRDADSYTSALRIHLRQFIDQKRALGVSYKNVPYILSAFDRFLAERNAPADCLSKELVDEFCARRTDEAKRTFVLRGSTIRQFGIYMAQAGYPSYVLPKYRVGDKHSNFAPYIFTHDEVGKIFDALDNLDYAHYAPGAGQTYPLLFRLLYGCGLRISEATQLKVRDVDLNTGELRLLNTKFNSERLVPLSPSLHQECRKYFNLIHFDGKHEYFFPAKMAKTLSQSIVIGLLRVVLEKCGIPMHARLHDFRHTFAVHSLNRAVQEGKDIYAYLPVLSKYLGHASVEGTEYYLRLTAEVFPDITRTFEQGFGGVIPEGVNFEETN